MASLVNNVAYIVNNGISDMETDTLTNYGYSNCIAFRTKTGTSSASRTVHLIISDSNYFYGTSQYDRAPVGSIGTCASGVSNRTLFKKFTSSAKQASCWAPA